MTTISQAVRRRSQHPVEVVSVTINRVLENAACRLREAAKGDLSVSLLHDLRIACRRAEAALRLCQDVSDRRARHWLMRRLATLRRACNQARDDDVLCQWIKRHSPSSNKSLLRAIRIHRENVRPQIVEASQRLSERRRFERRSHKLVHRLQVCERKGELAQAFGQRLFAEVTHFVNSLPIQREGVSDLHPLRIAGKRLRYASELVSEIWPDIELAELRDNLHLLQDRLGAMHDLLVGAHRLKKHSRHRASRAVRSLAQSAREEANRLERNFWRWLQACPIEHLLADSTAEIVAWTNRSPSA